MSTTAERAALHWLAIGFVIGGLLVWVAEQFDWPWYICLAVGLVVGKATSLLVPALAAWTTAPGVADDDD